MDSIQLVIAAAGFAVGWFARHAGLGAPKEIAAVERLLRTRKAASIEVKVLSEVIAALSNPPKAP